VRDLLRERAEDDHVGLRVVGINPTRRGDELAGDAPYLFFSTSGRPLATFT
jgi:hypothetical protein